MSNANNELTDVTERLIREASYGPGEYCDAFRRAGAAKKTRLSPPQIAAFARYANARLDFVSKVLVYDPSICKRSVTERRALYNLIKGGLLRVCLISPVEGYIILPVESEDLV